MKRISDGERENENLYMSMHMTGKKCTAWKEGF